MGAEAEIGKLVAPGFKAHILSFLFLSFFFAPPAFSELKRPPEDPPLQVPASLLHFGNQVPSYAMLVDKSEQRLHLYRQDADVPRLIKTFVSATGEKTGGKKRRGDKRTPEGVYFFTRVIESQNLSSMYGIRAFPIDYPNFLDRIDFNKGDGIWLHGTDKPLAPNSTNGCIVLDNRDVVELSQYIRFRQTPIIIEEKIVYTSFKELIRERERLQAILWEWKGAWETKELDRYMSFYSENFRCRGLDWKGWRNYKDRLNRQYKTIQIDIDSPIILKHNQNLISVFFQSYRSDRFFNEGTKRLYFTPEGGDWKIIGEEWSIHRGGETAPPISESILVAFLSPKTAPPKGEAEFSPATAKASAERPDRDLSQKFPEIQAFLATWKQSWETKDLSRYMDCYSKAFRGQGKGWEQWREHKKNLNELYRQIQVSVEDVKVEESGSQILVSFRQTYHSDGLKSTGQKNLILRQEENSWKIFRENFRRAKG